MNIEFAGKRVAVIGMGVTGIAATEALLDRGADVTLFDRESREKLGRRAARAEKLGARTVFGFGPERRLADFDLVIASPGVRPDSTLIQDAIARGMQVISEIELAYLISAAPIIAITGTNGKSTTTVLIGRMLEADGSDVFIAGNIVAGDIRLPLVTAAREAHPDSVIVAEVSSFQLELIDRFRPYIAAVLNVTEDHQDRYGSIEAYAAAKARIFKNYGLGDWAIVNADDPISAAMAPKGPRVLRFSRLEEQTEGAFLRGDRVIVRVEGREKRVCTVDQIPLPGEINQENVLAACCAAAAYGAATQSMSRAIRQLKPLEHRLEPVGEIGGVRFVNNSMCTNVMAAVGSIEAIEDPVVVISGGIHKGGDLRPFARLVASKVKHLALIGRDAETLRKAVEAEGYRQVTIVGSLRDAVLDAKSAAEPGDVVVLAPLCASHDMFNSFEDRGEQFKEIVEEIAKGEGKKAKR